MGRRRDRKGSKEVGGNDPANGMKGKESRENTIFRVEKSFSKEWWDDAISI